MNLSIGYFFWFFFALFCIINDLHFKKTYVIIGFTYVVIIEIYDKEKAVSVK